MPGRRIERGGINEYARRFPFDHKELEVIRSGRPLLKEQAPASSLYCSPK